VADGKENVIECNRAGCETQKVSALRLVLAVNVLTNIFHALVPPNLREPRVCCSWVDLRFLRGVWKREQGEEKTMIVV